MINRSIFTKRFKLLRNSHNLSSSALAELLKFKSKGSIGDLEAGKTLPSADGLSDISNLFAVSIDWLCGRIDEPYHNETLLRLEQAHIERLSIGDGDSGSIFLFKDNYVNPHKRIDFFSLPVRANIIFLLCWCQKEAELRNINNTYHFSDIKKQLLSILESSEKLKKRTDIIMQNFDHIGNLLTMKVTTPVFDITNQPENLDILEKEYLLSNSPQHKLFYNPEGELFYFFRAEDIMQPDVMKCTGTIIDGELKYTFGIFQDKETKQNRHFLYLNDFETRSIYPYLITGRGHLVFIAFTSFLSWKLGFPYNPYSPGNKDIIISSTTSHVSQKFISIGMTETSSSRLFDISDEYSNYVDEYLEKTPSEKVAILSNFLR